MQNISRMVPSFRNWRTFLAAQSWHASASFPQMVEQVSTQVCCNDRAQFPNWFPRTYRSAFVLIFRRRFFRKTCEAFQLRHRKNPTRPKKKPPLAGIARHPAENMIFARRAVRNFHPTSGEKIFPHNRTNKSNFGREFQQNRMRILAEKMQDGLANKHD